MWKTIFRIEWVLMRRDRGILAAIVLFGALVVLAAQIGANQVARLNEGFQALEVAEERAREQLGEKLRRALSESLPAMSDDPRDPLFMGQSGASQVVVLPTGALGAMAVGQRALLPQAMRVSMGVHLTPETNTEAPMVGPTSLSLGAFDLAFLFVVLFPLVVIALVYGVLSGERERGTLAMLLSQPISQQQLVYGKTLARALMLLSVTLVFLLLGAYFAQIELGELSGWIGLGVVSVIIIAWLVFWFGAGVFVNALGLSSANNALVLVGFWLGLVVILPGLIDVGLKSAFPPASAVHLMHEVREAGQSAEAELDALVGSHDDRQKAVGFAKRVVSIQERIAADAAPILEAAHQSERDRARLLSKLMFISPASLMQTALEDLAGSGQSRYEGFESQAENYHRVFTSHFYTLIKTDQRFTSESFAQVPTFSFKEEPQGDVFGRVLMAAGALSLLGVVFIALAVPRLRHIGRLTR